MKIPYQYPGDKPDLVEMMTGRDFRAANPDRHIRIRVGGRIVSDTHVDAVICDLCNAEVGDDEICGLTDHGTRLYCRSCIQKHLEPYFLL